MVFLCFNFHTDSSSFLLYYMHLLTILFFSYESPMHLSFTVSLLASNTSFHTDSSFSTPELRTKEEKIKTPFLYQPLLDSSLPYLFDITNCIPFYYLTLRPITYSSLYCCFLTPTLLVPQPPFTSSSLFIHVPITLTLHKTKEWAEVPSSSSHRIQLLSV